MKTLLQSIRIYVAFTLLLGLAYPVLVTLVANGAFPAEAGGSLVERKGTLLGSRLIGQGFKQARYFWPRPSAVDYNPLPSGGSNASGTSAALREKVAERAAAGAEGELRYASASGLDPDISPASAFAQASRIAAARGISGAGAGKLTALIEAHTRPRFAGFLGEPTVNVLELNLALDEAFQQ